MESVRFNMHQTRVDVHILFQLGSTLIGCIVVAGNLCLHPLARFVSVLFKVSGEFPPSLW